MESNDASNFLPVWHTVMTYGMYFFFGLAILLYVIYKIREKSIDSYKEKYDFIRKNENKYYRYSFYSIGIAVFMLINTYGKGSLDYEFVWFFVRLFIAVAGGTLVAYISHLILQYYHPTHMSKKLRKWRYMPRINPKTGNKMRLLSEEEEDVHLDEGMQAEENVFSLDYDVWMDDETGDTKIEKYQGHLEALQCNNCGFYTMRVQREEIIDKPTDTEPGKLVKHYECNYCGSVRATEFKIAPKNPDYSSREPEETVMNKENWRVIKIDIIDASGHKNSYEFQTIEQARQFLKESETTV